MANSASDAGYSEKDIRIKLIESGVISQMVTLPSNMFTSVTLPATLWFFDRAKTKKDEVLFVDARNIFTQVTRAHRKFSDEQIKNIAIISRLHEGKSDEFWSLVEEYKEAAVENFSEFLTAQNLFSKELHKSSEHHGKIMASEYEDESYLTTTTIADFSGLSQFAEMKFADELDCAKQLTACEDLIKEQIDKLWEQMHLLDRGIHHNLGEDYARPERNRLGGLYNGLKSQCDEVIYVLGNLHWLLSRFPDGKYVDVIGLCKAARLEGEDGIKDQDYSLNPGRYVGVVIEDDGMTEEEFKMEMRKLSSELATLNAETQKLEKVISHNMQLLFDSGGGE